jgi:uncharacterized protein (TIGR03435 family)
MRLLLLTLFLASAGAQAQSNPVSSAAPSLEVATIKPSDPAACCGRTFSWNGRHFSTRNTNLKYLFQWAYNLQASQVSGGPNWMDRDRFDLAGDMEGSGSFSLRQWKVALQRLLADRFQLQVHHIQKEMPAYVLVVAKGGPKIRPNPPEAGTGGEASLQSAGFSGSVGRTMSGGGVNATLPEVMGELQRIVSDRPVVDHTGLTGTYTFELSFTREAPEFLGATALPDDAPSNLFKALQEQLGLKLEPADALVDVSVIDRAEPPSEN